MDVLKDSIIDDGRVVLTPELKTLMRQSAQWGTGRYDRRFSDWASRQGVLEEQRDPRVCSCCVANALVDIFNRYVGILRK